MDAYVFDPVEKDDFITKTNKFQEAKKETSWEQYDSMVTTKHPLPESEMRALYDSSETWLEFFNALKSAMKKDMHALCLYMYPWITSFVQTVAKLKFTSIQFAIPVNNPKLGITEYSIKPYVKVGGKYTRKQYKSRKSKDLR